MDKLNAKAHLILSYLYQLRVLSYNEIKEFIIPDLSESYADKILKSLVKDEYIEKTGYFKENSSYQIKQKGIKYLDSYGLISVGTNTSRSIPLLLQANQIRINERVVEHQMNLNHFVLRRAKEKEFEYYDEKYMSKLVVGARPDGAIVEDKIYFLEMDMNTEKEKALNEKWKQYRTFLTSDNFYRLDKDILGLFILGGGVTDTSMRRTYLRKQILKMLPDLLSNKFNFIIGTEDKLLGHLNNSYKRQIAETFGGWGYKISKGEFSNGAFSNFTFDFYIVKLSDEGKLLSRDGEAEEYIIDDLTDGNLYSLLKLSSIASIESSFMYKYKRHIKYIAVVESEEDAETICKELEIYNENIFFTTPSRLKEKSINTALFQIDNMGKRWHFSGDNLKIRINE